MATAEELGLQIAADVIPLAVQFVLDLLKRVGVEGDAAKAALIAELRRTADAGDAVTRDVDQAVEDARDELLRAFGARDSVPELVADTKAKPGGGE